MKKLFLKIGNFFISIWNFFFGKNEVKETPGESYGQVKYTNRRIIPAHNNRKNNRGRLTQYILQSDGSTRAIYHGAK
jgi:hypothetical protein